VNGPVDDVIGALIEVGGDLEVDGVVKLIHGSVLNVKGDFHHKGCAECTLGMMGYSRFSVAGETRMESVDSIDIFNSLVDFDLPSNHDGLMVHHGNSSWHLATGDRWLQEGRCVNYDNPTKTTFNGLDTWFVRKSRAEKLQEISCTEAPTMAPTYAPTSWVNYCTPDLEQRFHGKNDGVCGVQPLRENLSGKKTPFSQTKTTMGSAKNAKRFCRMKKVPYLEAKELCEDYGFGTRLCTAKELKDGEATHSGCRMNNAKYWSSTKCDRKGLKHLTGSKAKGGRNRCVKSGPKKSKKAYATCCQDVLVSKRLKNLF